MNVSLYEKAYEGCYKNNIGPGPNAYSSLYDLRETDRFRKTAFPKQRRKLTEGREGPGPTSYEQHKAKDIQGSTSHPRAMFTLANRKIDIIRWRQAQKLSSSCRKLFGRD